jgi:hypothetical protein
MKRTVFLTCIGTLTLALTALGAPKGKSAHKSAGGNGARTAHVMSAHGGSYQISRDVRHSSVSRNFSNRHSGRSVARADNLRSSPMESAKIRTARTAERGSKRSTFARSRASSNREKAVARTNGTRTNRVESATTHNRRSVARANTPDRSRRESARVRNEQVARSTRAATRNNLAVNRQRNLTFANNVSANRSQNARITNYWRSNRFNNAKYAAFYNYGRRWHDRGWWNNHYSHIVFVLGGWWYWNAGYWYPAWGYDPYAWYAYDGPIYTGYANLTPDQVIVNVQIALRDQGYYPGATDGVMGPETRAALAAYQADHGLAVTSAIDSPTLANLGVT